MSCNDPENQPDMETRGVKNPKVVDLIAPAAAGEEIVLKMIEERPWSDSQEQHEQLSEKFNNYLDYVLDGWMVKQYPDFKGKRIVIELEHAEPLREIEERMLGEMRRYSESVGIGFRTAKFAGIGKDELPN